MSPISESVHKSSVTVSVVPRVPEGLESLRSLAFNLWWSWNYDALELFQELDPVL
ncbi:MAG: DUF3417 domain-containing protein, partial [Verrucomicrobia bacterium]|nr:DUF3417 domain-containing protein [Verrucomicrobiota bacterium]